MSDDLLDAIRTQLVPLVEPLGFRLTESQTYGSFDNATVVSESSKLRIRIDRDRGRILPKFGPPTEAGTWFDSDIVFEHLGLSVDRSFDRENVSAALEGIADFVQRFRVELTRMVDKQYLASTKQEIKRLKERRAQRLFGWKPPAGR